jgi:hypothetical protein
VLRAGGTPRVFDEVYPPSTLGIFLREFIFGHANQLAAVGRAHLAALAQRTPRDRLQSVPGGLTRNRRPGLTLPGRGNDRPLETRF